MLLLIRRAVHGIQLQFVAASVAGLSEECQTTPTLTAALVAFHHTKHEVRISFTV
jgi:hypothetical protein